MKFQAGIIGVSFSSESTLKPEVGWLVAENQEKILEDAILSPTKEKIKQWKIWRLLRSLLGF